MKVVEDFLTPNAFSRPKKPIRELLGVVIHWTANPNANAKQNRDFFDSRKTGLGGYGSAHYIIGQGGEIIQCIPEAEVAWHCGSAKADPESGKIYTNYAREKFNVYAKCPEKTSPNFCTLGIELCPTDLDGNFSKETIYSAIELCANILLRTRLKTQDITTHHDIVGWKDCPRLWTRHPELLDEFRLSVEEQLTRIKNNERRRKNHTDTSSSVGIES